MPIPILTYPRLVVRPSSRRVRTRCSCAIRAKSPANYATRPSVKRLGGFSPKLHMPDASPEQQCPSWATLPIPCLLSFSQKIKTPATNFSRSNHSSSGSPSIDLILRITYPRIFNVNCHNRNSLTLNKRTCFGRRMLSMEFFHSLALGTI